jgi:hypothetical protein
MWPDEYHKVYYTYSKLKSVIEELRMLADISDNNLRIVEEALTSLSRVRR